MDAKRQRGENNAANTQQQAQTNHVANAQQQAQANAQLRNPFVMQLFTQHVARRLNRRDLNSLRAVNRHTRDAIDAYPETEVTATRIARVKRDQVTGFDQIGPYATEQIMSHLDNPDDIESLREASMTTQRFVEGDQRADLMAAIARASPADVLEFTGRLVLGGAYDSLPDDEQKLIDRYTARAFIASNEGRREWRAHSGEFQDHLLYVLKTKGQDVLSDMNPDRVNREPAEALSGLMLDMDDYRSSNATVIAFELAKFDGPPPDYVFVFQNQPNGPKPPSPAAAKFLAHMLSYVPPHTWQAAIGPFAKSAVRMLVSNAAPVTHAQYEGVLQSAALRLNDLVRRMKRAVPGGLLDTARFEIRQGANKSVSLMLTTHGYTRPIYTIGG